MVTHLLTWNPTKWSWESIKEDIEELEKNEVYRDSWSCGQNKKSIKVGDRLFLMRLGQEPKGIVASGYATSNIYQDSHWDNNISEFANYIKVDFDVILDPKSQEILKLYSFANTEPFKQFKNWLPIGSGVKIPESIAPKLEEIWLNHINRNSYIKGYFINVACDNEVDELYEGSKQQGISSRYERNPYAREVCLKTKGYNCIICGFNFENHFGELGKDYIHVHHTKPLSERNQRYLLNPSIDLVPICPNCHSMIHRRRPAMNVEELKYCLKQ